MADAEVLVEAGATPARPSSEGMERGGFFKRAASRVITGIKMTEGPAAASGGGNSFYKAVAAAAEYIDRTGIDRNAKGEEEPHGPDPSIWRIGEAEIDLTPGHTYEFGGQLWYLASRAHDKIGRGVPIPGTPLNKKARQSGVKFIVEPPPKEGDDGDDDDDDDDAEEIPGIDGLDRDEPAEVVQGPSGMKYEGSALFCLNPADEPRRGAIRLIEHPLFDPLILLTITCNCITMAWESPLDPPSTSKAAFIDVCEWAYLLIFTFEMFSKITAYGFWANEHAYLKDAWSAISHLLPPSPTFSHLLPPSPTFSHLKDAWSAISAHLLAHLLNRPLPRSYRLVSPRISPFHGLR